MGKYFYRNGHTYLPPPPTQMNFFAGVYPIWIWEVFFPCKTPTTFLHGLWSIEFGERGGGWISVSITVKDILNISEENIKYCKSQENLCPRIWLHKIKIWTRVRLLWKRKCYILLCREIVLCTKIKLFWWIETVLLKKFHKKIENYKHFFFENFEKCV